MNQKGGDTFLLHSAFIMRSSVTLPNSETTVISLQNSVSLSIIFRSSFPKGYSAAAPTASSTRAAAARKAASRQSPRRCRVC